MLRDNFTCQYCGQKAPDVILHVDHKVPKVNGGTNQEENLVTCCSSCNVGKNKTGLVQLMLEETDVMVSLRELSPSERLALAYLRREGPHSATETARAIGRNRINISKILNTSPFVEKLPQKVGRSVLFRLRE